MPSYTVDPEGFERLVILDGAEWIEIRHELAIGEQKYLDSCGLVQTALRDATVSDPNAANKPSFTVDLGRVSIERARLYLLRWSLRDAKGQPLPLAALDKLRVPVFEAIENAITDYLNKRDAEKNVPETTTAVGPALHAVN